MAYDMLSSYDNTYSYADDTLMLANANNELEAKTKVQSQLNNLQQWYETNGLNLNVLKTKYILIANCNMNNPSPLTLNNIEFEPDKSINILGVALDKRRTLETHQSSKMVYILRKIRYLLNYEEA